MKKTIVFLIIIGMICVSMTGAFSLIGTQEIEYVEKNIVDPNYISTEEATAQLANTASKYLNANVDDFEPYARSVGNSVDLPWIGRQNTGDLLEWYVRLVYDGTEFFEEVPISIQDFSEKFLKHPEYGEILKFNVDDDPDDDVQVIIGFYWSIIMYPDGQEQKSLETRFRVVQINDEIADQQAEFEVWSEIHLNYGLVKEPPKSRNRNSPISNILPQGGYKLGFFIGKLLEFFKNRRTIGFPLLKNLINKINVPSEEKDEPREDDGIGTLDADDDYLSIGAGYRCPEGEQIPLFTEKRFAFAKGIDWKGSYATIFKPTIFQH
ncbi:MAG: hypothetical protein KAS76_06185, partial [Thermoplasmatales archaeon]|nr:hypothetical protein [Thermoplasmatales archaeon]